MDRDDESSVLILSLAEYYRTLAPPSDWLKESRDDLKGKGLDNLSMEEIDAEVTAAKRMTGVVLDTNIIVSTILQPLGAQAPVFLLVTAGLIEWEFTLNTRK